MLHRTRLRWAIALAATLAIAGCGDDDDTSTNPPPAPELNSPTLVANAQFVHTFARAGSYPYHCNFHSAMSASVTVATGAADSAVVMIVNSSSNGFLPSAATIKPGGYVRWHNMDATSHTVTSH